MASQARRSTCMAAAPTAVSPRWARSTARAQATSSGASRSVHARPLRCSTREACSMTPGLSTPCFRIAARAAAAALSACANPGGCARYEGATSPSSTARVRQAAAAATALSGAACTALHAAACTLSVSATGAPPPITSATAATTCTAATTLGPWLQAPRLPGLPRMWAAAASAAAV